MELVDRRGRRRDNGGSRVRLVAIAAAMILLVGLAMSAPVAGQNATTANETATEEDSFGPVQHDFGEVRIGQVHETDAGIKIEVEADRPTSIDWTAIDARRYGTRTIGTSTDYITIPHRSAVWIGYDGKLAELDYQTGGDLLPGWIDPRSAWATGIASVVAGIVLMLRRKSQNKAGKKERKA